MSEATTDKFTQLLERAKERGDDHKLQQIKQLQQQYEALQEAEAAATAVMPECYYNSSTGRYEILKPHGVFEPVTQDTLRLFLRKAGFAQSNKQKRILSPLEEALVTIVADQSVDRRAALAGHDRGVTNGGGTKILVPADMPRPKLEKGDFSFIQNLLDTQLGRDDQEQVEVFKAWLATAMRVKESKTFQPGQALCLVGKSNTCKTFIAQKIILPLLGGRSAKPVQYLKGKTDFNLDLCESEVLLLDDDDTSHLDYRSRQAFASMIKELVVGGIARVHGKGKDGFTASLFWRTVICMNDDADTIQSIPAQDDSVKDKIIVFKMTHVLNPPIVTATDWKNFGDKLRASLPAFGWHLMHEYVIPERLQGPRYGIASYQNPDYKAEFLGGDMVGLFANMLNSVLFTEDESPRNVSAEEIVIAKHESVAWRNAAGAAFSNPQRVGGYLRQLAERYPGAVTGPFHRMHGNEWRISRIPLQ